jgi:hypothetical protein
MARLLILDGAIHKENAHYRGVHRFEPFYVEELDMDHELNQSINRYLRGRWNENEFKGYVADLALIKDLLQKYAQYKQFTDGRKFELIEVTRAQEPPEIGTYFLGYDIAWQYSNSLLSAFQLVGSLQGYTPNANRRWDDETTLRYPLMAVIANYFEPQLNDNRLFNDYHTATFCLDCMTALRAIDPLIYDEGGNRQEEVIGVYVVDSSFLG